jgi:hypothetical protein
MASSTDQNRTRIVTMAILLKILSGYIGCGRYVRPNAAEFDFVDFSLKIAMGLHPG